MTLARDLGKSLAELRRMPQADYQLWVALYLEEAQQRALDEARARARAKMKGKG